MTRAASAVLLIAATVVAAEGPATQPATVGEYLDTGRRVLVVLARSDKDAAFVEQRASDRVHAAAYAERDMVVLYVTGDDATADGKSLPPGTAKGVRLGLDNGDPFVVLLIGKDRGVKLRETKPVPGERLIALIDGMPMRQREAAGRKE